MRTLATASVLALVAALWVACSGGPSAPPTSGIEGQALIGPTCPVVIEGTPCPDQPFQATVVVWDAGHNRQVLTFTTDEQGRFRVPLPPGDYLLEPQPPEAGPPTGISQNVTVAAGTFVSVTIEYDSGIR